MRRSNYTLSRQLTGTSANEIPHLDQVTFQTADYFISIKERILGINAPTPGKIRSERTQEELEEWLNFYFPSLRNEGIRRKPFPVI